MAAKVVLFTGGGYDPVEDNLAASGTGATTTQGNTVYMIDAMTGAVLWDAKEHSTVGSSLTHSFPSNVVPLDVSGNGLADILYAGDVGGQIWRFDFNANPEGTNFAARVVAAKVANLSKRLYNEIDVIGGQGSENIYLSVGTGNRSHPKASETNAHYILKDTVTRPSIRSVITATSLSLLTGTSNDGWYIPLSTNEKVLSRSNTVANNILFTTFTPTAEVANSCDASLGTSKVYKIDLAKKTSQSKILKSSGIPPMPMLIPPKRIQASSSCNSPANCPASSAGYSVLSGG